MSETAETLLQKLQQILGEAAGVMDDSNRGALRAMERAYGAQATRYGRLLNDLTEGSFAWDLFEKPGRSRLPRVHELSVCEPVLQVMRESGELAERERLLTQRDAALAALWRREITAQDSWTSADAIHDDYFAGIQQAAERYRAHYGSLRQATQNRATSLAGPRIRSRVLLQPPLMPLLFRACHQAGQEFSQGENTLEMRSADGGSLDALAWDVAALAVSAFFVRTEGSRSDATFPFFLEDYFQWRGVDPRKRTQELRRQVAARIEMFCSDQMPIRSDVTLWRTDSATGRRKKTPVRAEGSFLVKHASLFRAPGGAEPEAIGYLLSLGAWAYPLAEERALLGIYPRCLAEYDLQRQQWERRIGWYLVFQMNNQGSKMTFQEIVKDGKTRTLVTPQHPLKMKTVLAGSLVPWEEMARTNPGKVIKQWIDALERLRRDGLIGPWPCLDGAADGSDLPTRGRLAAMLERRYQFVPGKEILPHLRAKQSRAAQKPPR
ncbi:MAG: hypothetical protein M3Y13_11270 [Armatimonadota bacterium]|nr:hypothetical protein [Armatimonadota bacterium]